MRESADGHAVSFGLPTCKRSDVTIEQLGEKTTITGHRIEAARWRVEGRDTYTVVSVRDKDGKSLWIGRQVHADTYADAVRGIPVRYPTRRADWEGNDATQLHAEGNLETWLWCMFTEKYRDETAKWLSALDERHVGLQDERAVEPEAEVSERTPDPTAKAQERVSRDREEHGDHRHVEAVGMRESADGRSVSFGLPSWKRSDLTIEPLGKATVGEHRIEAARWQRGEESHTVVSVWDKAGNSLWIGKKGSADSFGEALQGMQQGRLADVHEGLFDNDAREAAARTLKYKLEPTAAKPPNQIRLAAREADLYEVQRSATAAWLGVPRGAPQRDLEDSHAMVAHGRCDAFEVWVSNAQVGASNRAVLCIRDMHTQESAFIGRPVEQPVRTQDEGLQHFGVNLRSPKDVDMLADAHAWMLNGRTLEQIHDAEKYQQYLAQERAQRDAQQDVEEYGDRRQRERTQVREESHERELVLAA